MAEEATTKVDVTVIGGGIAGLVSAFELVSKGLSVTLIEESETVGGAVAEHVVGGLSLDAGAESFATRHPSVRTLIEELGLSDALETPVRTAWIQYPGEPAAEHARALPVTGMLGIPADAESKDVAEIIGTSGVLQALKDHLASPKKIANQRPLSLAQLVESRMGKPVLDKLVRPIVAGVYSVQPEDLDADLALPGIRKRLVETGSLAKSVAAMRQGAPAGSAVGSLRGGMHTLVTALQKSLAEQGVRILTKTRVTGIESDGDNWLTTTVPSSELAETVGVESAETVGAESAKAGDATESAEAGGAESAKAGDATVSAETAKSVQSAKPVKSAKSAKAATRKTGADARVASNAVVLCVPEKVARELLAGIVEVPPVETEAPEINLVTLVVDKPELDTAPRGSGVIVAEGAGVRAKALTHASAKWGWLEREAGPGTHVLRLSYGKQGEDLDVDDEAWLDTALADASILLDTPLVAEDVLDWDRVTWQGAQPSARLGHAARTAQIRAAAASVPGLALAGAWLSGTGLARVIPDAQARAEALAANLGAPIGEDVIDGV